MSVLHGDSHVAHAHAADRPERAVATDGDTSIHARTLSNWLQQHPPPPAACVGPRELNRARCQSRDVEAHCDPRVRQVAHGRSPSTVRGTPHSGHGSERMSSRGAPTVRSASRQWSRSHARQRRPTQRAPQSMHVISRCLRRADSVLSAGDRRSCVVERGSRVVSAPRHTRFWGRLRCPPHSTVHAAKDLLAIDNRSGHET